MPRSSSRITGGHIPSSTSPNTYLSYSAVVLLGKLGIMIMRINECLSSQYWCKIIKNIRVGEKVFANYRVLLVMITDVMVAQQASTIHPTNISQIMGQ